jgi:hypothetical protein
LIGALATTLATSASAIAMMLITAGAANAQAASATTPEKRGATIREKLEHTVIALRNVFEKPLHPLVSGVAPGGGMGAGLGYSSPGRGPWQASARALYTLNNYWLAQGTVGFEHRRGQFEAFGRAREMRRLDFYGRGPTSALSNRSTYSYRDPAIGARGGFRVTPWLTLGGRVEHLWPYARSGERAPSIEQIFLPGSAPGLFSQPRFGRYQGSVDANIPGGVGDAFYQGTRARTTYTIYDDRTLDLFNFRRVDLEGQQTFAGFGAYHRLTLSGWVSSSMADGGQEVPFYLQHTLGGKSAIRGLHEHRLGSDGTDATLRGFRSLRFRDNHLLLMQAEYRLPVWGPVEATVFADAGKVAAARSDLDFTGLRRDFGFSVSMMEKWTTKARIDVAFGSGEGARVLFTLGELTP